MRVFTGTKNDSKTAASRRPAPAWETARKSLEHSAEPADISTGWRVPFPGTSVVLNLFQVTQPVSASGLRDFFAAWLV